VWCSGEIWRAIGLNGGGVSSNPISHKLFFSNKKMGFDRDSNSLRHHLANRSPDFTTTPHPNKKITFSTKKNGNFWSKIEILVKNRNFSQKSKF